MGGFGWGGEVVSSVVVVMVVVVMVVVVMVVGVVFWFWLEWPEGEK